MGIALVLLGGAILAAAQPSRPQAGIGPSGSNAGRASDAGEPMGASTPSQPEPSASVPPDQLVLYSNRDDGYEVLLPRTWIEEAAPIYFRGAPYDGVRKFGRAGNHRLYQALTISVGRPDGSVWAGCEMAFCREISALSVDDLASALESNSPWAPTSWEETRGEVTVAGESGLWEQAAHRNNCLGCPWAMYHVFAIHDGRPAVLAFDVWNVRFARLGSRTEDIVRQIVASFRFLDRTDDWQTFTSDEAGFAIDLPEDWVEEPDADPHFVWVHGRGGGLRIRIGDADGYILTCDVPIDSRCQNLHVDSVETLRNMLETAAGVPGRAWTTAESRQVSLGSSAALRIIVRDLRSAGQGTRYFIAAMEDGRPIIILWQPGTFGGAELQELLASFRLLD